MAARLNRTALVALVALLALLLGAPARGADTAALEDEVAQAAHAYEWPRVLALLSQLSRTDPQRYAAGRFDYLTARALAETGRAAEALPRFERFAGTGDILDVPARLAAGKLRFAQGDGLGALNLLFPLLQRREGAVARRALRTALDALETKLEARALERLLQVKPAMAPREKRRAQALRAEALEEAGRAADAERLREELLDDGKRDDAAAIVLARELKGLSIPQLPDRLLSLLVDTARAQRDMELAERLAVERDRRAQARGDATARWKAGFELARLRAGRGRWGEAEQGLRAVLAARPRQYLKPRGKKDDGPGTAAFFARVRFNLAAVLEKQSRLDEAAAEFQRVEAERTGPAPLAALQRARLEMRRGRFEIAESILARASLAREPGRVEGTLLLLTKYAEAGNAPGARRALARIEELQAAARLPEPWRTELPYWRGRVAQTAGDVPGALAGFSEVLAIRPYSAAGELARGRLTAQPEAALKAFLSGRVSQGVALVDRDPAAAKGLLLPAALLGDAAAKAALLSAYRRLPAYAAVLDAPDYSDEKLPVLCGDAAACRLLQLGLPQEAEPIVRDAIHLDSWESCILASRLAETADAGPAALEAAEAVLRRLPEDFLLDLAPKAVLRAVTPRPFDRLSAAVADETGVPRDLLYAIMRQESRFDREAVSPAAARGLMQLTLPAAGDAARELNEEPPAYFDLYDPARSLRLGAQTVRSLLVRFQGDAPSAVAAYNAGGGQTYLWTGGARDAGEALLGAINYVETRTYFRRVLANRQLYRFTVGSVPGSLALAGTVAPVTPDSADRPGSASSSAAPPGSGRSPR